MCTNNLFIDTLNELQRNKEALSTQRLKVHLFEFAKVIIEYLKTKQSCINVLYGTMPLYWYQEDYNGTWYKDYLPTFYSQPVFLENYSNVFSCIMKGVLKFNFSDFCCKSSNTYGKTIEIYIKKSDTLNNSLKITSNTKEIISIEYIFKNTTHHNITTIDNLILLNHSEFENFETESLSLSVEELTDSNHIEISSKDIEILEAQSALFNKDDFLKFLNIYAVTFNASLYLTFIPTSIFVDAETKKEISLGGIVLCSLNKIEDSIKNELKLLLSYKYKEIAIWDWNEKSKKKIFKETIKSTVAAIMARNMSHNLGSHVITNTKAELEHLAANHGDLQPKFSGLAKLLHYIQERQDFIAVLAAGETYAKGPVNIKEHIFDYFAYDGPSKRHNSSEFKNYILDHLVRSESFTRDESQQLELKLILNTDGDPCCLESLHSNDQAVKALNKIGLSIPYGLNGRQAFLTIIENFIRNSAKHLKNSLKSNLVIGIAVEQIDKEYEITIFDNKANFKNVVSNINKQKEVFISEKSSCKYEIKSGALQILSGEKPDHNNKGLKEMLICLAWMKGEDNYSIIENEPSKLGFNVVSVDNYGKISNGEDASFGIRFSMDCYHEVVYIINSNLDKNTKAQFKAHIFEEYKADDLHDRKKLQKFIFNLPAAQTYVIVDDNNDSIKEFRKYLPRVISYKNTKEDVYNSYYEEFISKWVVEESKRKQEVSKVNLVILDQHGKPVSAEDNTKDDRIKFIGNNEEEKIKEFDKSEETKYVLFRNHYEKLESQKDGEPIKDFIKNLEGNCIYIEGISGGNYTNSLIRTAEFNTKHINKVLESSLTKICLIDERLYSKFKDPVKEGNNTDTSSLTLADFKEYLKKRDQQEFEFNYFMKQLQGFAKTKSINLMWSGVINHKYKNYINNKEFGNAELTYFEGESKEAAFKNFIKAEFTIKAEHGKSYGSYYKNKNIDFYNIDITKCNYEEDKLQKDNILCHVDNNYFDKSKLKEYDFVSIHYGVVEKLHEKSNKVSILETLVDLFQDTEAFVSVHSGRGDLHKFKDEIDESNQVSFIPLSGIEWALDNSKFMLTELFYNQKYIPLSTKIFKNNHGR